MTWDLTPEDIAKETDVLIAKSKVVYDAVGALSADAVTYENIINVSDSKNVAYSF